MTGEWPPCDTNVGQWLNFSVEAGTVIAPGLSLY